MSKVYQIGGGEYVQSRRFYNADKDTVKDCPVVTNQSQSNQVRAKQNSVTDTNQTGGSTQTGGSKTSAQAGGNPAPLPCQWFNPQCGCVECPVRCPLRYGVDLHQDPLRVCPSDKSVCLPTNRLVADQLNFLMKVPLEELDRLDKASASGFLNNCGCPSCSQIGAGMGFSTALDEQTGGTIGAPLYIKIGRAS